MKRLLALLCSLALLAWLIHDGRWQQLGASLERLTGTVVGVALSGMFASYLLRGLRIYDEFRQEVGPRYGACLRIVLIHNALVNVLPFRGGEAAFPLLMRQHFGTPLARGVASLFWLRLQDAFVVMALAALVWPGLPAGLRALGVAGVVGLAWYLPRWARRPHAWLAGGGLLAKLGKVRDAFADSTRHARFGWLWTLANWSVKLAAQAWLLAAVVPTVLHTGAAGALGAELAAILPIQGVAGFGTYEAGAAAALLPAGVPLALGLQAALALHLFVIASAVTVGAVAWLIAPGARPSDQAPLSRNS
ncbi:MAG: lysylphosphatidylglycerol synthase domain-containing protein [Rhodocyclaceae bacterium]|nr:lysylphosphatidylglycerol synthase domain-containing protein [Rhodocyclaceae bacterium]